MRAEFVLSSHNERVQRLANAWLGSYGAVVLMEMLCGADRSPKDLLELAPGEQLRRQTADIEFAAALSALSILRWGAADRHASCRRTLSTHLC